jgi:8-amino-7-oxononanoate synthase
MLDFTSALYLGLEHASWSLPGWERLTLGKPAALQEVPGADQVQRELAEVTGCERVLLGASVL